MLSGLRRSNPLQVAPPFLQGWGQVLAVMSRRWSLGIGRRRGLG